MTRSVERAAGDHIVSIRIQYHLDLWSSHKQSFVMLLSWTFALSLPVSLCVYE